MLTRSQVVQTIVLVLLVIVNNLVMAVEKPIAEKLTKAVDKRIPPQIAYFIPDQALNDTLLNYISGYGGFNGFSGYHPPTINFSKTQKNWKNHKLNRNESDLDASQQHPYQYVAPVAKNHKYIITRKLMPNTLQNFSYQINFGKAGNIRDKESDFPRIERLQTVSDVSAVKKVKTKPKPKLKIHIKRPTSFNYANTLPDLRKRIMFVKLKHKNEFEDSNEKQHKQQQDSDQESDAKQQTHSSEDYMASSSDYYDDTDTNTNADAINKGKTKKTKTNNNNRRLKSSSSNKPRYSSTKLSHATVNVENESNGNSNGRLSATRKNPMHQHDKYCEHAPSATLTNELSTETVIQNEPDTLDADVEDFENIAEPQKGFEIYLTKVIKHPKVHRMRRRMKINKKKPPRQTEFVPTRILSSVRRMSEVRHKPRKFEQPTLREKLRESGGHVVYAEDGYEDSYYDHGKENKDLEYSKRTRARRSTNVKNLKGQELIDHLDILIRNISDYLNSSEIIPDTDKKYPLYNSTNENIYDSSLKYSEYAKPVVDDEISSELYESKTKECEEADEGIADDVDLSNAHNKTGGPKKRLGKLGDRLECLKTKLFGEQPLDNPLFYERKIQQPQPGNLFTSATQESKNIETIASVYSDVMDNIKFNSVNQHQRIFSDYGISDNFPFESVNVPSAVIKPVNELNTNEKYTDYRKKTDSIGKSKTTEKPLTFANPFKDPVQLQILDISKYIPTAKYPPTASDYPLQTDFQPIIPPYFNSYNSKEATTPSTTTVASTTQTLPLYGPVRTLSTPPSRYRKVPYHQVSAASNLQTTIQNSKNSNLLRMPHQNIVLLKHRRPIALVRVISNPVKSKSRP